MLEVLIIIIIVIMKLIIINIGNMLVAVLVAGCFLRTIYKNLKKQNNTNKEPRDEYLLVET